MIQEFINYQKSVKGLSDNTLRAYTQDLQDFARWARPQGLRWSTLTKQDIDRYTAESSCTHSSSTRRRRVTAIRCLLTWAQHEGILDKNPARFCQSPKQAETLPKAIDKEIIMNYLNTEAKTDRSRTIHALIALIADTGVRLQEAIDIRFEDINAKDHSIRIHGKGKKERIVYYTNELTVRHCSATAGKREGYLIDESNQWTLRSMMSQELPKIHAHPHAIRHTFATEMLNAGASLTAIQNLLGHKTAKTTERYARMSNNSIKREYQQYH